MPDDERGKAIRPAGTVLCVFLLVYFIFPPLFLFPPVAFYGKSWSPPRAFVYFFAPVNYLYQNVPLYHDLLDAEEKWLGLR